MVVQQLNVNLTVPIPSDSVLIKKVELEELKQQQLSGLYWSMKDLEARTGMKRSWLQDNILYKPRFKKILDVKNNGFVYYPQSQGQKWSFNARKMAEFLDENFHIIFS